MTRNAYETQIALAVENLIDGFEPDQIPALIDAQAAATCVHLADLGIPHDPERVRIDIAKLEGTIAGRLVCAHDDCADDCLRFDDEHAAIYCARHCADYEGP